MTFTPEKYIVCSALPYANGGLHVGHLAGAYLPGDVYARFKRLQGHDVHYLCGTDEFGAAITIRAMQEGLTPREVVDKHHTQIEEELARFGIHFDVFSRTTHDFHIQRAQDFFLRLKQGGYIDQRSEERLYCASCKEFLPDRYVTGQCPQCGAAGARGDQCEKCGAWYDPESLINPICQICKTTEATLKQTTHWYLRLDKLENRLREWLEGKSWWRRNVLGYANQPLKAGLAPRSITRDLAWGVPVPLEEAAGKVLYVWIDAPIGYISASEEWSRRLNQPDLWREYWEDKNTKLVHFVGKDNIIFHTIVWPALLMGDNRYILPHMVAGNEFLNLEGEKISTSRNWAVWAKEAADAVDTDLLRFYLISISPETSDSDFSWKDFQLKINGELADVIGNLANRCLSFIQKNYAGVICTSDEVELEVRSAIAQTFKKYSEQLEHGLARGALAEVVTLARICNSFFQNQAPWKLHKSDPPRAQVVLHSVCVCIKAIALMLYPICPKTTQKLWKQLGFNETIESSKLSGIMDAYRVGHSIGETIEPIVVKIDDSFVESQISKLRSGI